MFIRCDLRGAAFVDVGWASSTAVSIKLGVIFIDFLGISLGGDFFTKLSLSGETLAEFRGDFFDEDRGDFLPEFAGGDFRPSGGDFRSGIAGTSDFCSSGSGLALLNISLGALISTDSRSTELFMILSF